MAETTTAPVTSGLTKRLGYIALLRGRFLKLLLPPLLSPMAPSRGRAVPRRPMPKGSGGSRVPRPLPLGTLVTRRYQADTLILGNAVGDSGAIYSSTIGSLFDSTEFTNLFDSYRILDMTFTFTWQPWSAGTPAVNYPTMYSSIDLDGGPSPSIINDVMSRGNVRVVPFDPTHRTRRVTIARPGVNSVVASGTGGTRRSPLLDVALNSEPHWGLVVWFKLLNSQLGGSIVLSRSCMVELHGVR
jgi:hypothetical protein